MDGGSTPVARRAFNPNGIQQRQQQMMQPTPRAGGGYYGTQPGLEMHKFITPTAQLTQWAGSMLNGVWGSSDPGPQQQPQMQDHYPQMQQQQQMMQQPQQQGFMGINSMNMGVTQVQQQIAQTFAAPEPQPAQFQVRQIGADGIAIKPEEEISIATVCMKCLPCICCMLICFLLITVLPALSAEGKLTAAGPGVGGAGATPTATPLMIVRTCRNPNDLAISFQGGPAPFTHEVMDALEAVGARGTFFVSGTEVQCIYGRSSELRRMRRNGHMIGIRGWSGRSFQAMNRANAVLELRRIRAAVMDIAGVLPKWFRPPNNLYTPDTMQAFQSVTGRGAAVGLFSINGDDITGNVINFQAAHAEFTSDRFRSNGAVTVLHDSSWNGAKMFLPWVLAWARNNSLQMVTMGACQGMPEASFWYDELVPIPGAPVDTSAAACTALEQSIK